MTIIDGKKVADQIKMEIGAEVEKMVAQGLKRPHLAGILRYMRNCPLQNPLRLPRGD